MPRDAGGNFRLSGLAPNPKDGKLPMGKSQTRKPEGEGRRESAGEADEGGEKTHTITEHGDGTLSSRMHDGTKTEHPDHLHMLAHVGHHVSGGEAHHVMHHDGVSVSSHGIQENGEHGETEEHNTAEEAKDAVGKFFDEEAGESAHQHGGDDQADGYGSGHGLGGFGG